MSQNYKVMVKGKFVEDDNLRIDLPRTKDVGPWDIILPPCPDCGEGKLIWYEAGFVPGTRMCDSCESMFSLRVDSGNVFLVRERFF